MPNELSPNEHILREPGSLQLDPSGEGVAIDETKRLIASNKVEGTPVYKRDGEQLGKERFKVGDLVAWNSEAGHVSADERESHGIPAQVTLPIACGEIRKALD
jgi:hypothetical protein